MDTLYNMKIDVVKVAKLANLPLPDEEVAKLEDQLGETLSYIGKLNEVDTSSVEPTHSVTGLENVTRDDETESSLPQAEALKNARNDEGFFKVKAIFDES